MLAKVCQRVSTNRFHRFQRALSTQQFQPKLDMTANDRSRHHIQEIRQQFQSLGAGNIQLRKDERSGVATICLSNPDRKNSLSGKMMAQLTDILAELELWTQGKAVIVFGADGFFCSGGDLTTVRQIDDPNGGRRMSVLMQHNFARLHSLPLISVALVEGMALGGGAEITTACDYRLMTASAQIGFVHSRLGIVSAWGGGARLTQLIGPQKALDLMLTGRRLKSAEAFRLGLIDDVIQEETNALEESRQWIERYIRCPPETVRAIKGIVNGARYLPLELALRDEMEYSVSVWGGSAHKKALTDNIKHNVI